VHVETVADPAADKPSGLQLPVPPTMDSLGARAFLRVGAGGALLLALDTTAGVDLLRRVEEVVG
jgi:hypothetical protein